MIIFQRVATFQGPPQDVVPWAIEVTEYVRENSEFDPSLWQGLSGGPLGTLAWSAIVPGLTSLEHGMDELAQDPDYLQLVSKAQDWIGQPGEDFILRMVHTAGGEYVRPGVGAYVEGINAVPNDGRMADAMAFGVEISDLHSRLTHSSVLFCTNEYGEFGAVRWMALFPDAGSLDDAAELLAKDSDYLAKIDGAGELFRPGSGVRQLARRIA